MGLESLLALIGGIVSAVFAAGGVWMHSKDKLIAHELRLSVMEETMKDMSNIRIDVAYIRGKLDTMEGGKQSRLEI